MEYKVLAHCIENGRNLDVDYDELRPYFLISLFRSDKTMARFFYGLGCPDVRLKLRFTNETAFYEY